MRKISLFKRKAFYDFLRAMLISGSSVFMRMKTTSLSRAYLSQNCREVREIHMSTASAEAVRLIMASFPKLSKIGHEMV
jgi:hypothetical protein